MSMATTCLENLGMSGNLMAIRELIKSQGSGTESLVRENCNCGARPVFSKLLFDNLYRPFE